MTRKTVHLMHVKPYPANMKGHKMAKVTAALTKEQGITFVAVMVKDHVVNCQSTSNQMIQSASATFDCSLVALVGERNRKIRGSRQDVVDFVANNHRRLPWREYSIAA